MHVEINDEGFCQFRLMEVSKRCIERHKQSDPGYVLQCALCGIEYVGGESAYLLLGNWQLFDNCWCCKSCVEEQVGFAQTFKSLTELRRLTRWFQEMKPLDRLEALRNLYNQQMKETTT